MKKSFIMYTDALNVLDAMDDAQAATFIRAIFHYHKYGTLPDLEFGIKMALIPLINQFKRDSAKWEAIAERNRLNGSKGGRPPNKPKKTQNNPLGYLGTQNNPENPEKPVNVNVNVNVNDNVIEKEKIYKKEKNPAEEIIAYFNQATQKNKYQKGSDKQTVEKYIEYALKCGDSIDDIKNLIEYKLKNPNTKNIDLLSWINTKYIGTNLSASKEWQLKGKPDIPLFVDGSPKKAPSLTHRMDATDFSADSEAF